jgi:hypothetical protein
MNRKQPESPGVIYSRDELEWINRKATEYADQSGYPDAMAVSLAMAEFRRLQDRPKARVVSIGSRRESKPGSSR